MAIVSDGQPCWVLAEMRALGFGTYFDSVIMSGDHGFRKPDPRLIKKALLIPKRRRIMSPQSSRVY
jgi:putative hydrolase of the HAD superfamily